MKSEFGCREVSTLLSVEIPVLLAPLQDEACPSCGPDMSQAIDWRLLRAMDQGASHEIDFNR